jgi:hypothetical protein
MPGKPALDTKRPARVHPLNMLSRNPNLRPQAAPKSRQQASLATPGARSACKPITSTSALYARTGCRLRLPAPASAGADAALTPFIEDAHDNQERPTAGCYEGAPQEDRHLKHPKERRPPRGFRAPACGGGGSVGSGDEVVRQKRVLGLLPVYGPADMFEEKCTDNSTTRTGPSGNTDR